MNLIAETATKAMTPGDVAAISCATFFAIVVAGFLFLCFLDWILRRS